jgi:hypothetical protein
LNVPTGDYESVVRSSDSSLAARTFANLIWLAAVADGVGVAVLALIPLGRIFHGSLGLHRLVLEVNFIKPFRTKFPG